MSFYLKEVEKLFLKRIIPKNGLDDYLGDFQRKSLKTK